MKGATSGPGYSQSYALTIFTLTNAHRVSCSRQPIVVNIDYGAGDDRANRLDSRFDSVDKLISVSNDHFLVYLPLTRGKHVIRGITDGGLVSCIR